MSFIASAGMSRVMIIPGGMIAPSTSCDPIRRLVYIADQTNPATSASTEMIVIAASCGRVTSDFISCMPPCPPESAAGDCSIACWEWSIW